MGVVAQESMRRSFEEMERLIRDRPEALAIRNKLISNWSVSEHYDHLLKVCTAICESIARGPKVDAAKGSINLIGRLVLLSGRIPRGRAEAPAQVMGEPRNAEELLNQLERVRELLSKLSPEQLSSPLSVAPHPRFGRLNAAQWMRFLAVHQEHHMKIVREILG